jgi:hypothetical protein
MGKFEKSRTLLDDKTFEAACNVHCPCRPKTDEAILPIETSGVFIYVPKFNIALK